MFTILYLPTGQVMRYYDLYTATYRPARNLSQDEVYNILGPGSNYESRYNNWSEDAYFQLTMFTTQNPIIPKHLIEVVEV